MSMYKSEFTGSLQLVDDTTGNVAGMWDDFVQLSAKYMLNKGGMIVVVFPDGHPILNHLVLDNLFRVTYTSPNWLSLHALLPNFHTNSYSTQTSVFMYGLYRDRQVTMDESGNIYHMLYLMEPIEVLSRYISGFPTGSGGKSEWAATRLSVIANDIVRWNMTAEATVANGRIRDAPVIRGLEDMGAIAGTAEVDFKLEPGSDLLDAIKSIAKIAPFNFSVEVNALTSDLEVHQSPITGGTLGTDLRDAIRFHLHLDNIKRASSGGDSLAEKTVAIVGGGGEGASRTFVVRTGEGYSTPENDKERWVNASTNTNDELPAIGDQALAKAQARGRYSTDIGVSQGYVPFRDFNVGDLVTAFVGDSSSEQRVTSVELVFDQTQKTQVYIELENFIE